MKKVSLVVVVFIFVCVFWTFAESGTKKILGAILSIQKESAKEYKTASGLGIRVSREIIYVPAEYGSLASVVQDGKNTIIWFSNHSGNLRNVVIRDCSKTLYEIRTMK